MKIRLFAAALLAGVLGLSAWAQAHHSLAATYQRDVQVPLEGRLVQFVFRNPHSFVHIEVTDPAEGRQRWAVEWTGTAALARRGMDAATLRPGDQLILSVHPSRAPGEKRALMAALQRPSDGLAWGDLPEDVVE